MWLAEFDGVCSTDILVFPKNSHIDNKFLKYRLLARDFVNYASANSSGVNLPRVNLKALGRFEIDLPPLPERRRIVAWIEDAFSRLDAGLDALRRAKSQLKRYRQSVLNAAVTGELTCKWREEHPDTEPAGELLKRILEKRRKEWKGRGKYREPDAPVTSRMPEIPAAWKWVRLDAICAIESGMSVSKNRKNKNPVVVPYLRVANVQRGHLMLDEGTQTTNLASINKGVLSSFPVPLPPLAEQHQIVAEVEARTSAIDHLEAELDRQIARGDRLRQSTLADAFSGKL